MVMCRSTINRSGSVNSSGSINFLRMPFVVSMLLVILPGRIFLPFIISTMFLVLVHLMVSTMSLVLVHLMVSLVPVSQLFPTCSSSRETENQ
jgi:hypothetical protein